MKKYILSLCVGTLIILPTIILAQGWVARYNGPGNSYDRANAIALDNSGNIYVTGWSWGSGTFVDYATVKYDSSGDEQWVARYNGPGNDYDFANAVALDNSGNIYVTGVSVDWADTYEDYATVKYDSSGVAQWVARYNGPGNGYDFARAIALDNSGNIYVTGESDGSGTLRDYATVKYDSSGVEQWVERYNGPGDSLDHANAIALDNSGNIYVTGRSWSSGTDYDYATIKYLQVGVVEEVGSNKQETRLEIYPNPFTTSTSIHLSSKEQSAKDMELQIYDASGRLMKSINLETSTCQLGAHLVPGVYFLKFTIGEHKEIQKLIKIR